MTGSVENPEPVDAFFVEPVLCFLHEPGMLVVTEGPVARGWVVLAEWGLCPAGCLHGEVLAGGDLLDCSTCRGSGHVPVGIGGAVVAHCGYHEFEFEGESIGEWRSTLRNVDLRRDA